MFLRDSNLNQFMGRQAHSLALNNQLSMVHLLAMEIQDNPNMASNLLLMDKTQVVTPCSILHSTQELILNICKVSQILGKSGSHPQQDFNQVKTLRWVSLQVKEWVLQTNINNLHETLISLLIQTQVNLTLNLPQLSSLISLTQITLNINNRTKLSLTNNNNNKILISNHSKEICLIQTQWQGSLLSSNPLLQPLHNVNLILLTQTLKLLPAAILSALIASSNNQSSKSKDLKKTFKTQFSRKKILMVAIFMPVLWSTNKSVAISLQMTS